MLNRTQPEVLARVHHHLRHPDPFIKGAASYLVTALPLPTAQGTKLVRMDATEEAWADVSITNAKELQERLEKLIDKAWVDANNKNGMNCRKNLAAIVALVWLCGAEHEELIEKLEGGAYDPQNEQRTVRDLEYYGKCQLVDICEHFGINWASKDNDEWPHVPGEENPARASDVLG